MEKEIERFRNEALKRNLCNEYSLRWNQMKTKHDLLHFSLDPKSISYVALSTHEGWGLSIDFISKEFSKYINGKGYSDESALFCQAEGLHDIRHIENNIMNTAGRFIVQKTKCPILHINNNSDIDIECKGMNTVKLYLYDTSKVNIIIDNSCKVFVMSFSEYADVKCNIPERMKVRKGNVYHYAYGDKNYNLEKSNNNGKTNI